MAVELSSLRSESCRAYPFSNDAWQETHVNALHELLSRQRLDRERASGLVVGAGGLPYILGYLGVSQITILDKSPAVIESVRERVQLMEDVASWEEYKEAVEHVVSPQQAQNFKREFQTATQSGLRGNFAEASAAAAAIELRLQEGDIIDEIPRLAEQYRQEGRVVSFANVTNVGMYLQRGLTGECRTGRGNLACLLDELPIAENAIIVESGPGPLVPSVRTAEAYFTDLLE